MPPLWKIKPQISWSGGAIWVGPGAAAQRLGFLVGQLAEQTPTNPPPKVWFGSGKEQVLAIVGKRGSGKSFTLGVIAEGLSVCNGPRMEVISTSNDRRAVLLFDPLDLYWTLRFSIQDTDHPEAKRHFQMAHAAGVTDQEFASEAWIPGTANRRSSDPEWFRILSIQVSALSLDEWQLFIDANVVTDPMGQALADLLRTVATLGYSVEGVDFEPDSSYGVPDLIRACDATRMLATYHPETLRALRQRLMALEATGLLASDGIQLNELLSPGRTSVIMLGRLPQAYRDATVAVVTRLLIRERQAVAAAEKRLILDPSITETERTHLQELVDKGVPKTMVILDEAQSFLAPGAAGITRSLFVQLVKEGRNFGLSVVIATQQPSAIDLRILSQVEVFVAHQLVTDADIRAVRDNMKASFPESIQYGQQTLDLSGLMRMLPPGACIVSASDSNETPRRTFVVSIRPRATVHGGIEV